MEVSLKPEEKKPLSEVLDEHTGDTYQSLSPQYGCVQPAQAFGRTAFC